MSEPDFVGIVNVTPDSFSDGGFYNSPEKAVEHARSLRDCGASIVDIGGCSTRPGSRGIDADTEWQRVAEVVTQLTPELSVSVDTYQPEVATRALAAGAEVINDTFGARMPGMWRVIADYGAKIIVMYSGRTDPHGEVFTPRGDLIGHMKRFFEDRLTEARAYGIAESQLILDPGMGAFLANEAELSWEMIARIDELVDFGLPLMLGVSRKGFLRSLASHKGEHFSLVQRDCLSAAVASHLYQRLKDRVPQVLFRVHDVQIHKAFQRLSESLAVDPVLEFRRYVVDQMPSSTQGV
jgi:dihydropteroate synthase